MHSKIGPCALRSHIVWPPTDNVIDGDLMADNDSPEAWYRDPQLLVAYLQREYRNTLAVDTSEWTFEQRRRRRDALQSAKRFIDQLIADYLN